MDALQAKQSVKDYAEHLYRASQLAARQTLARRTLEEILAEKVAADVRREMAAFGVRVGAIALKDVILPGDMREILNQVVTAEKQAQANLIRRREETAATRSLLNTTRCSAISSPSGRGKVGGGPSRPNLTSTLPDQVEQSRE